MGWGGWGGGSDSHVHICQGRAMLQSEEELGGGGRVMPGEERVNCQRTELVMQRGRC